MIYPHPARHHGSILFMSMVFACLGASAQDVNDKMPHEIQSPHPAQAPPRAKYKFDLGNKTDSVEKGNLPSKGLEPDARATAPGTARAQSVFARFSRVRSLEYTSVGDRGCTLTNRAS